MSIGLRAILMMVLVVGFLLAIPVIGTLLQALRRSGGGKERS
jgi:hypothetical protein